MALDTSQLMQVLDQYQSRLHRAGNDEHDEEFEYVRQIIASSIFHRFLRGEISQEEETQISLASQDVLSADFASEAIVSQLTGSDVQKRRLARRKSLKALRNAVLPQISLAAKKTHSLAESARPTSEAASANTTSTTSPLKHTHMKSLSGPETARKAVQDPRPRGVAYATDHLPRRERAPSPVLNGRDIDTPLEGLERSAPGPVSPGRRPSEESSNLGPRVRNLSNSTNTLIERLSPPSESPTKDRSFSNNRVSSESQPNVHGLGLNRPEMDLDLFTPQRHVLGNPGPSLVPEWDPADHYSNGGSGLAADIPPPSHLTRPHLHYSPSPSSHTPPRPFPSDSTPQHRLTTTEPHRHPPPAPPPPYPQLAVGTSHRRTKSFEDFLNSPEFDPLNFHRTPIPPSLMTPRVEVDDPGTPVGGRNRVFHLMLEKGADGLGFLVKNREGGEGGLVVQYLSPGGLAERDGWLKPNDIITAINGQSLEGVPHSEAVRLLQAVRGVVQLSCLREQELAPPSSPSPHAHPPPSPLTLTSHPSPSPSAHAHPPPSPLTLLPHHHAPPSAHAQPPPSPLSLTPHPPPSPHTAPQAPPSPSLPLSDSPDTAVHIPEETYNTASNTPLLRQKIQTIVLANCEVGVGLSVASHRQGGTMVAAILELGAARKDGRLAVGDRLLQVNDESIMHMRCNDVAAKLHLLEGAGQAIRLVVAHSERESEGTEEEEVIPEVMDSSGDEMEEFEVELYKKTRGLGITIAGLVKEDTGDELKGLYITSINDHGAVGKDGRAKVGDRILRVDGHSLRGLENMEAAAVLRNSGNPVRLVFGRPKTEEKEEDRETNEAEGDSDDAAAHPEVCNEEQHLHGDSQTEQQVAAVVKETEEVAADGESEGVPPDEIDQLAVTEEDAEIMDKWSDMMGPGYEIKIARVVKSGAQGGLGICMESTAQLDELGHPQEGSTHHLITLVKDGPVGQHGELQAGDEILQVNTVDVLGLEHDQAIDVVKETPTRVMIVVCRRTQTRDEQREEEEEEEEAEEEEEEKEEMGEGVDGEKKGEGEAEQLQEESRLTGSETTSLTAESDDEKQQSDILLAPPTNESGRFGSKDISRRFERQSWRERHAEERRRLKQRFEQRREEYEQHIRELEEELLQREKEQREMQLLMAEEEEARREEEGGRERRRSTLLHPSSSPTKFDYSTYHDSNNTFSFPDFQEREVVSPDTDSSLSVLSPVPGTGFWEPDVAQVTLLKGEEEGLGFSILDFADPHHEGERIILIQSLVEGGVAERDGRLRVGDRLVAVNDISVVNTSLQFAVKQLVDIPGGSLVELTLHHPVLAGLDFSDSPTVSPLPNSPHDLLTSPNEIHDLLTSPCDPKFSRSPVHNDLELPRGMQTQKPRDPARLTGQSRRRSSSLSGLEDLEYLTVERGDDREGQSSSSSEESEIEEEVEEEEEDEVEGGTGEGEHRDGDREEGDREEGEREKGEREEGGEGKVKRRREDGQQGGEGEGKKGKPKKKLLESEDDEPPPPYSKTDPQEKKSSERESRENVPQAEPPQPPATGADVKEVLEDSAKEARRSDRRGSLSPHQLSRISSPSRGLSLSELTRVTPEDQERWRRSRESLEREKSLESLTEIRGRSSLPRDRFGGSLEIHASHHVREWSGAGLAIQRTGSGPSPGPGSSSPLHSASEIGVNDHSQVESCSDTTLVGSQSQSQSDTGIGSLPDGGGGDYVGEGGKVKGRPQLRLEPVDNRKKARRSPKGGRSPKSRDQGKSPRSDVAKDKTSNLTVSYTHSQVTNTSSQDSIQDGLSPEMSDYDHSNELDNDPREIHIARTSSTFGMALTQDSKTSSIVVKSVKGAVRKDGRIRTGDQILAINHEPLQSVSLAKAAKILKKASSKSEGITITYLPAPHIHGFSSNPYGTKSPEKPPVAHSQPSQQHFPSQPLAPSMPAGPLLHNIPKQDSFAGSQAQNVGMAPSHPTILPPQMVPQGPPAMSQIIPTPPTSQWTSYPLGPGAAISPLQPPPYNYHQLPQPARQTFGPPVQPVVWQVQQPSSLQLPVGQSAPQPVAWILREPPHYAEHLVQHHMMSGPQYSLSQTANPLSVSTLPPSQPPPPASLQPPSQPPPPLPSQPQPQQPQQQPQPPLPSVPSLGQTQPPSTTGVPRMTKAQSETKLRSDVKPGHERRHKSHGGVSPRHPPHPYTVYHRRQQQQAQAAAAAAAKASNTPQTLVEEPFESNKSPPPPQPPPQMHQARDRSHEYARRMHNMSHDMSHDQEGGANGMQLRNSVDREIEEDPVLRKEFPTVDGVLFEVWLNKGSGGLGMSIVANRDDHAPGPRGIVIMGIQNGGVADRSKMIMWGDMILKINDTCVIGKTQQDVQEMLMKASPRVRFVMLRQAGGKGLERTHSGVDRDMIRGLPQVRVVHLQRDNEKGLGFNVAEGGQGGLVTVATIIPGGPAEKEGTLQVGDQLISIDGQKTLGYSFEKARHLLQQARARGWVQLIVTSRGGAAAGGPAGVEGAAGGGNLRSSVPESVVLRQKKRSKGSSLKSSRRRPVSVDFEPGVVRTPSAPRTGDRRTVGGGEHVDRSGGGGGGGGARPETGEGTGKGGAGNRNSHTLTERDVEIGFQKMEKHNVILPGKKSRITIFKGSQVLGLTVVGGVDTYLHNIIIERVIPDSPAAKDSRLCPGDRILEVNDVSLSEATCEDALSALQYPNPFIHLTVIRDHSSEPLAEESSSSPTASSVERIVLVKPQRAGLGLLIHESPDQSGVYVQEVVENQAAFLDGRIQAGDKILAINHNNTVGASQDTVFKLLQACQGKVVLTVQHRDTFSPATSTIDFSESEQSQHFTQPPPPPPGVKFPFGGPLPIPTRDPPPYSSSSFLPDPQTGVHPAMWPPLQERHTQPSPPPPIMHRSGEGKAKFVRLHKGPSGLGFTIVGGKGSAHGDMPIYVNRVPEEGVAGRDRRLRKGDQLLAVNGISFEGVTHQFAAETLKQQSRQGDVELTVLSFE